MASADAPSGSLLCPKWRLWVFVPSGALDSHVHQVTRPRGRHGVFVDPTGRRRRIARGVGIAVGCLLTAYLAIVAFGLATGSGAPLTPWPDAKPSQHDAAPRLGVRHPKPRSFHSASKRPTVRSSPSGAAPTAQTAPPATRPATTAPTTTHPGRGRAYGLSKSPNPKKH